MADNILLSTNVGTGETLATDDVGGAHYQWIKLAFGADDSVTKVASGAGLPVNVVADNNSLVDDAAFTPGTSRVLPIGFEFDDTTPDSVNEGDVGAARMSANRSIYVNIRDNAGNERGLNIDANGALAVTDGTGSITVDNAGTFAVQAAKSGTWTLDANSGVDIGDVTINNATGGSAVNIQDGGNTITVDNGGTFAVQAAQSGTWNVANAGTFAVQAAVAGDVAHDAADANSPVKIGGQGRTTLPTAVADADRVNAIFDDLGRLITCPHSPRDLVTQNRIALSNTTETTLLAAVASIFLDVITLIISHEGTTADVRVDIRDATAGTVRLSVDLAPDGGGAVIPFAVPFKQTTVNNNWTAQLSGTPSSGSVYITAQAISNN